MLLKVALIPCSLHLALLVCGSLCQLPVRLRSRTNRWYDGRRDIIASTQSALTYLEHLYDRFDDWELALAAFNAGQGRVRRAIQKNAAQGSLQSSGLNLPKETMAYVPRW